MDNDDIVGEIDLVSLDQRNTAILDSELKARNIKLPEAVVDHLGVLGRESEARAGTFISYELDQLYACEKYSQKLKEVFFQNDEPVEVTFNGRLYKITKESFDEDIKYIIIPNDIGKAGWNKESEEVVTKVFNNIQMKKGVHDVWMQENKANASDLMLKAGVTESATPEQVKLYIEAFEKGDFFDVPVSVMVKVVSEIAKASQGEAKVTSLELSSMDVSVLAKGNADPRKTTMREFYDKHVEWGEEFLRVNVKDERLLMLMTMGLMHHYTQGYLPKGFEEGHINIGDNGLKIVAFIQLLDMADAYMKRSNHERKGLKESVLGLVRSQARGNNKDEKVKLLEEVAGFFDWEEIGKLLDERVATIPLDVGSNAFEDTVQASLGIQQPQKSVLSGA